jgi:hypothetical protein
MLYEDIVRIHKERTGKIFTWEQSSRVWTKNDQESLEEFEKRIGLFYNDL